MARTKSRDYTSDVEALLMQAEQLPHGITRINLCEEAVRLADLHNDIPLGYRARMELVEAGTFAEMTDVVLVAFTWCIARYDENPEQYDGYNLLWRMKWVSDDLANHPEIQRQQIADMFVDMERRYLMYCNSIQPVLGCRRSVELMMGDIEQAKATHKEFMKMHRCFLSDCEACDLDSSAKYHLDVKQRNTGIKKLQAVINGGMRCSTVPARTYGPLLVPLLQAGRGEEAVAYYKKGYPLVRDKAGYAHSWGEYALFLALTENDAKAVKCVEKHLGQVEMLSPPYTQMGYLRDLMVAFECLADRKATIKMRLPENSPLANADGKYDTAALATKIRGMVADLSKRFDERNGNTYHADLLAAASKIRKYAVRLPV